MQWRYESTEAATPEWARDKGIETASPCTSARAYAKAAALVRTPRR
jgi:hypothetical protein